MTGGTTSRGGVKGLKRKTKPFSWERGWQVALRRSRGKKNGGRGKGRQRELGRGSRELYPNVCAIMGTGAAKLQKNVGLNVSSQGDKGGGKNHKNFVFNKRGKGAKNSLEEEGSKARRGQSREKESSLS